MFLDRNFLESSRLRGTTEITDGEGIGFTMKKEANSTWDVVGAALLAMAIPLFIAVGLGLAALFGQF